MCSTHPSSTFKYGLYLRYSLPESPLPAFPENASTDLWGIANASATSMLSCRRWKIDVSILIDFVLVKDIMKCCINLTWNLKLSRIFLWVLRVFLGKSIGFYTFHFIFTSSPLLQVTRNPHTKHQNSSDHGFVKHVTQVYPSRNWAVY